MVITFPAGLAGPSLSLLISMTILIEINFEAQVLGETQMAFQLLLRILCEANMRTSTAATLQCICIDLHLWPAAIFVSGHVTTGSWIGSSSIRKSHIQFFTSQQD